MDQNNTNINAAAAAIGAMRVELLPLIKGPTTLTAEQFREFARIIIEQKLLVRESGERQNAVLTAAKNLRTKLSNIRLELNDTLDVIELITCEE